MKVKIEVSKNKYDSLLTKKFGDDFIYKGSKYRISGWGNYDVKAIKLDKIGGKGIDDNEYLFVVEW